MTEEQKKSELAFLERKWQEETRKIKKYRLMLKGAEDRRTEIEEKIRNL